ncbi:MAG TPA: zinc-ribbon domain-containing protein [Nitrososphaeraceae archaeon]|nr:zinc-ribbon domain-containing protein [Nitrososphaeraceae archaeon]
MMIEGDDLREKKLRGSGGYVFAKITEEEQKKGNLGGPELFIAGVGRLDEDRFSKYYCSKCEREYEGSPAINYDNPNEELGEGVTLIEKGEYKCRTCNNTLAQYRKFDSPTTNPTKVEQQPSASVQVRSPEVNNKSETPSVTLSQDSISRATSAAKTTLTTEAGFVPIQSLIGMLAYDSEALLVGRVQEIGLRKSSEGNAQISIKIVNDDNNIGGGSVPQANEVFWNNISKIGDIVLIDSRTKVGATNPAFPKTKGSGKCLSCGYQNEKDAIFCEECGTKLT